MTEGLVGGYCCDFEKDSQCTSGRLVGYKNDIFGHFTKKYGSVEYKVNIKRHIYKHMEDIGRRLLLLRTCI